jgi:hypothetical protein
VVREALSRAALHGLPDDHHFYITFRTDAEGVVIPPHLAASHPEDITIVLQHEYWDLSVNTDAPDSFGVTLSFNNRRERLVVPFAAVTGFADPSAKFGLQFQYEDDFEDSLDDDPLIDAPRRTRRKFPLRRSARKAARRTPRTPARWWCWTRSGKSNPALCRRGFSKKQKPNREDCSMPFDAAYAEMFPLGKDDTPYRTLTGDYVKVEKLGDKEILVVDPKAIELLTYEAFKDINFLLRPGHLAQMRKIMDDPRPRPTTASSPWNC